MSKPDFLCLSYTNSIVQRCVNPAVLYCTVMRFPFANLLVGRKNGEYCDIELKLFGQMSL